MVRVGGDEGAHLTEEEIRERRLRRTENRAAQVEVRSRPRKKLLT